MTIRDFLFGSGATSRATDWGLLILRVGVGLALAFAHGLGKLPPSERFIEGVAEMGFVLPVVFAWAAALSEFVGGLLVALGLLTRPAAIFAGFTMAVAFFVRHGGEAFGSREKPFLFLVAFVALAVMGAGRYAVDGWMRQRQRS